MALGELFTLLGYLTGAFVLRLEGRRLNLDTVGMRYVALAGLVGGVLAAKATQWAVEGLIWSHPLGILDPRLGGKALIGGLAGGWLAVEVTKRKLGIRRGTGDLWALALPAGEAVGRLGCWFNGCCFGTTCPRNFVFASWQHEGFRHPAQLYSAALAAALFGVLWALRTRVRQPGDLWKLFLLLYGLSRFGVEFFRERDVVFAGLSTVQIICLETALLAAASYAWTRFRSYHTRLAAKSL